MTQSRAVESAGYTAKEANVTMAKKTTENPKTPAEVASAQPTCHHLRQFSLIPVVLMAMIPGASVRLLAMALTHAGQPRG